MYWNAHFFGESFYGWSIGDKQSLSESGPFHSQGRIGASNQPWQGIELQRRFFEDFEGGLLILDP